MASTNHQQAAETNTEEGESADESAGLPALIPQAHGGALYAGGVRGNRGGSQPPSILREHLRGSLEERVPILEAIADGEVPEASTADRIRAVDLMAKYGLGAASDMSVDQVRAKLLRTCELLRARLGEDVAEPIIRGMEDIWVG